MIIDAVVFGMIDLPELRRLRRVARFDFWIAVAAIVGVLSSGVLAGVVIGVALSLLWLVKVSTSPPMPVLEAPPGVVPLRLDGGLFFATSQALEDRVRALMEVDEPPQVVVLSFEGVNFIDSQGAEQLAAIHELVEGAGATLRLAQRQAAGARRAARGRVRRPDRRRGRGARMTPLASTTWSLAAISGVLLAFIALESVRPRLLPPAFAFTAAGLIVGGEVLGWLDITPEAASLRVLAEATLALVLFSDASRIDLRALRNAVALPARLLGIGLPLTIVAGTVAAVLVFPDLSLPEAAALAIVLAATDAALGQAVVTDERLPVSIREGLNVESGLNDGLCVPALIIALTLADESAGALSGSEAARVIAESIGYGVLMGVVAGVVAALVHRRATTAGDEEQADWRFLLTLVAPALAYGLAAPLDGSGFIAAFVAGLVYGTMRGPRRATAPLPAEAIGVMLNAVTFVVFGAAFLKPLIERATWSVALYALLSLTVVRMLPVAIATLGTGASPATVAYLGWFGPRGLASIVFAVIVVEAAVPHTSTIVDATALTVIASIVLHGFSAGPLTERYVKSRKRGRSTDGHARATSPAVHRPAR